MTRACVRVYAGMHKSAYAQCVCARVMSCAEASQRDVVYDLRFPSRDWRGQSPEVKDLLMAMLTVDPAKRITAAQVRSHRRHAAAV